MCKTILGNCLVLQASGLKGSRSRENFSRNYQSILGAVPLACSPQVSALIDEKLLRIAQAIHEAKEQVRDR